MEGLRGPQPSEYCINVNTLTLVVCFVHSDKWQNQFIWHKLKTVGKEYHGQEQEMNGMLYIGHAEILSTAISKLFLLVYPCHKTKEGEVLFCKFYKLRSGWLVSCLLAEVPHALLVEKKHLSMIISTTICWRKVNRLLHNVGQQLLKMV